MAEWKQTIHLHLPSEPLEEYAKRYAKSIVHQLSEHSIVPSSIISSFKAAKTLEEIDSALSDLYNWADFARVWIDTLN